jgi:glutamine---fructose-6-phosphate transaminase (isomerizing)
MKMATEMWQQAAVLSRLIERRVRIIDAVGAMAPRQLSGIVLTARGSSDHAAIYGRYVLQIASRRPVALAAPSLHTLYGSGIDCSGYLAIATSPSGRTAEIVSVLREYARSGAASIAVTNDPTESPERSR